jgi:glutamate dehydrogenase
MWFLRHRDWLADLQATLAYFSPGVARLSAGLREFVSPEYRDELDAVAGHYIGKGVPESLAQRIASLDELYSALDLVEVSAETGRAEATAATVYFALGGLLDLYWLGHQINALPAETRWQSLARSALRNDLSTQARLLAANALTLSPDAEDCDALIGAWESKHRVNLERYRHLLADVKSVGATEMSMLSVLLRELRTMG